MLRTLFYPLLPYRSFVLPILVACAFVLPCWVALRLYRHRGAARTRSWPREFLLLAFVMYLAGLAAVTLTPNQSARVRAEGTGGIEFRPTLASLTCSSAGMPSGSRARGFCARNARGNVALFFPLGLMMPFIWPSVRFWKGLGIACVVSCSIELIQYLSSAWGSYRAADVNDIVLNVAGASVGLAITSLWRSRLTTSTRVNDGA